jgi:predicted RNase H-like HicB family nuclease
MQRINIIYWQEEGGWLGYLQEYPDYWTQDETLEDLKEHLRDLYKDVASGEIPRIRRFPRWRSLET